ncbi:hypothetical protein MNBD_GAMMA12-3208 [hydrothermal vent metagenome]|uniref:Uncharacterized protein n=1 Tax=hydrothermal vent metagenome TaxID=652676 RepID=A0A3B0YNU5_9ZZZZ
MAQYWVITSQASRRQKAARLLSNVRILHMKNSEKFDSKKKDIIERIRYIEDAIIKGNEYLETGKHANWQGFRPFFTDKVRDGKLLPPHKDWVKNVFIPNHKKALRKAEEKLEKLN